MRRLGRPPGGQVVDEVMFRETLHEEWLASATALDGLPSIPTRAQLLDEAARAWMRAAHRCGLSITTIARINSTSRRAVRDLQKRLGVYRG